MVAKEAVFIPAPSASPRSSSLSELTMYLTRAAAADLYMTLEPSQRIISIQSIGALKTLKEVDDELNWNDSAPKP